MSEKSEVQNLDEPAEATEVLDATPAAVDVGHVAQGEPKEYGEEGTESVAGTPEANEVRGPGPQADR